MSTIELRLEPLSCPSCIKRIEKKLQKTKGMKEAQVYFNASKVKASFDEALLEAETIQTIIEKLGYPVISKKTT